MWAIMERAWRDEKLENHPCLLEGLAAASPDVQKHVPPVALHRETFAAGAVRCRVWICYFEPALLQVLAVIENGTANEESALRIDHQSDIGSGNHDVFLLRSIDQVHGVLQAGTTASDHREAKGAFRFSLFFEKRSQFAGRVFGDLDQSFVADFVIDRRRLAAHK